MYKCFDLEEILDIMEPEFETEVFKQAFQAEAVLPYVHAIKALEKKLSPYTSYNTLAILYVHYL